MTGLVERIKQQGADIRWRALQIPAWGEPASVDAEGKEVPAEPLKLKVKTLSLDEQREWSERIGSGDVSERVLLIMQRTYDAKGEKQLFDPADPGLFSMLRNEADPMIIGGLVAEILRMTDREAVRKN